VLATHHWGGQLWPILEVSDAATGALEADRLDADFVVAIGEGDPCQELASTTGFQWNGNINVDPFDYSSKLNVNPLSMTTVLRGNVAPTGLVLPNWDDEHPLDLMLAAEFGAFDDSAESHAVSELLNVQARRESFGTDFVSAHVKMTPAIAFTTTGLKVVDRHAGAGFVVLDPDSVSDLCAFWTVRSQHNTVMPWPTRDNDLVKDAAFRFAIHDLTSFVSLSERPEVTVWSRHGIPQDLQNAALAGVQGTKRIAPMTMWRTAFETRPPVPTAGRPRGFSVSPAGGGFELPLPELPFTIDRSAFVGCIAAEIRVSGETGVEDSFRATVPPLRSLATQVAILPGAFEPFARPITNGVVRGVLASRETVHTQMHSGEKLTDFLYQAVGYTPTHNKNAKLIKRLIRLLGGVQPDSVANQPSVRQAMFLTGQDPHGKSVPQLRAIIGREQGDWPERTLHHNDYALRVLSKLTSAGLLAPRLQLDCFACGNTIAAPPEAIQQSVTCDLCGATQRLGQYVAEQPKMPWLLTIPAHVDPTRLNEVWAVMSSLSVLAHTGSPSATAPALYAVGTTLDDANGTREVDFTILIDDFGVPAVVIGEAKGQKQTFHDKDFDRIEAIQTAIRASGVDCYIAVARLTDELTLTERSRLRAMCDKTLLPIRTTPGAGTLPVYPIVLLKPALSSHAHGENHPIGKLRNSPAPVYLSRIAHQSCIDNLGLDSMDDISRRPVWKHDEGPGTRP